MPVGKKSRVVQAAPAVSNGAADRALINDSFARLGIPSSRNFNQFAGRALEAIDKPTVERWDELRAETGGTLTPEFFDLIYRDMQTAMILSAGARSDLLRQELAWALPLLHRDLKGVDAPLIVEVGSGHGVPAAVISRALGCTVIAIDRTPSAQPIATDVAARLGASVEAHVGGPEDLAKILAGRTPSAVVLFGTMPDVQPHDHVSPGFSWLARMRAAMAGAVPTLEFRELAEACRGAGMYFSEPPCPDRTAEIAGCGAVVGLSFATDRFELLDGRYLGVEEPTGVFSLMPDREAPSAEQVFDSVMGRPVEVRPGTQLDGIEAELSRRSMKVERVLLLRRFTTADGSVETRTEVSATQSAIVEYVATSEGAWRLQARRLRDESVVLAAYESVVAQQRAEGATVADLAEGAEAW
jgi:hypothetical protein